MHRDGPNSAAEVRTDLPQVRLYPPAFVAAHQSICRKASCTLYENARSIASEFATLFLIATCARPPLQPSLPHCALPRSP